MYNRTYMRFPHRVDILKMERTNSASGQKKAKWYIDKRVKCFYVPHRATIRVSPTSEETEKVMFFFPPDANIDFQTRFENLSDRVGNVVPHLEYKTFEVVEINHFSNYAGKPHHMQVIAESVIE